MLAVVEHPVAHNKPWSTYPFDLRHLGPGRRCRIRAAAHVGSRPCCREQPRLRPTRFQPASLGSTATTTTTAGAGSAAPAGYWLLLIRCSPGRVAAGGKANTLAVFRL